MAKLSLAFLLRIILLPNGKSAANLNPTAMSVTCRNYGKVSRGVLNDCDPTNFHCILQNPTIIVNFTELICIDYELTPKGHPIWCLVTQNVPLLEEKCLDKEDCNAVTVSCPISENTDNAEIIGNVVEEKRVVTEQENLPPLPARPEDSTGPCFSFRGNRSVATSDGSTNSVIGSKPCMPVDAVCQVVDSMLTPGKSTVVCTVQHSGKLHECLFIWDVSEADCRGSHCTNLRVKCPILDEYTIAVPVMKSASGFLGLVLSLAFIIGVTAACIGNYFQQICRKRNKIPDIKNENSDDRFHGNNVYCKSSNGNHNNHS